MNYFKKRGAAIGHALAGCRAAFATEAHLRLEVTIALAVSAMGWYCRVSITEWLMIGGCITLVLCLELFNSALEKLCDLVHPGQHPGVRYVKDVAAGAVLIACLLAIAGGVLVFYKYLA